MHDPDSNSIYNGLIKAVCECGMGSDQIRPNIKNRFTRYQCSLIDYCHSSPIFPAVLSFLFVDEEPSYYRLEKSISNQDPRLKDYDHIDDNLSRRLS